MLKNKQQEKQFKFLPGYSRNRLFKYIPQDDSEVNQIHKFFEEKLDKFTSKVPLYKQGLPKGTFYDKKTGEPLSYEDKPESIKKIWRVLDYILAVSKTEDDAYKRYLAKFDNDDEIGVTREGFSYIWKVAHQKVKRFAEHYFSSAKGERVPVPLDQKYIGDHIPLDTLLSEGYSLITAPLGSGKTQLFINYTSEFIREFGDEGSVIFLLPRRKLAVQIHSRLSEAGVSAALVLGNGGLERDVKIQKTKVFVCNYEGFLSAMAQITQRLLDDKVVWLVMDECQALENDHFRHEVNTNVCAAIQAMIRWLGKNTGVYPAITFATATARPSLYETLEKIVGKWEGSTFECFYREYVPSRKAVLIPTSSGDVAIAALLRHLLENDDPPKIFISSCNFSINSSLSQYALYALEGTKHAGSVVDLTSSSADEYSDEDIRNAKVVITTSVIDSGYSVETDQPTVVIVFGYNREGWSDILQRLSRVRDGNGNVQFYWIFEPRKVHPTIPKQLTFSSSWGSQLAFPKVNSASGFHTPGYIESTTFTAGKHVGALCADFESWLLRYMCTHYNNLKDDDSFAFHVVRDYFVTHYGYLFEIDTTFSEISAEERKYLKNYASDVLDSVYQRLYVFVEEVEQSEDKPEGVPSHELAMHFLHAIKKMNPDELKISELLSDVELHDELLSAIQNLLSHFKSYPSTLTSLFYAISHFVYVNQVFDYNVLRAVRLPTSLADMLSVSEKTRSRLAAIANLALTYMGLALKDATYWETHSPRFNFQHDHLNVISASLFYEFASAFFFFIREKCNADYVTLEQLRSELFYEFFLGEEGEESKSIHAKRDKKPINNIFWGKPQRLRLSDVRCSLRRLRYIDLYTVASRFCVLFMAVTGVNAGGKGGKSRLISLSQEKHISSPLIQEAGRPLQLLEDFGPEPIVSDNVEIHQQQVSKGNLRVHDVFWFTGGELAFDKFGPRCAEKLLKRFSFVDIPYYNHAVEVINNFPRLCGNDIPYALSLISLDNLSFVKLWLKTFDIKLELDPFTVAELVRYNVSPTSFSHLPFEVQNALQCKYLLTVCCINSLNYTIKRYRNISFTPSTKLSEIPQMVQLLEDKTFVYNVILPQITSKPKHHEILNLIRHDGDLLQLSLLLGIDVDSLIYMVTMIIEVDSISGVPKHLAFSPSRWKFISKKLTRSLRQFQQIAMQYTSSSAPHAFDKYITAMPVVFNKKDPMYGAVNSKSPTFISTISPIQQFMRFCKKGRYIDHLLVHSFSNNSSSWSSFIGFIRSLRHMGFLKAKSFFHNVSREKAVRYLRFAFPQLVR